MADYELSDKADDDLTEIYIFSFQKFGEVKADAYLLSLDEYFSLLAANPHLGRKIDHIRQGYFQQEHGRHSIFYRQEKNSITIMWVLHHSMDSVFRL